MNLSENKGKFGLPLGGSIVSFLCVLDLSIGNDNKSMSPKSVNKFNSRLIPSQATETAKEIIADHRFCGGENDNNKHFLLRCPLYDELRTDLFDQLSDVLGLDVTSINDMDDDTLCHRLLFGDPSLGIIENRVILEATISFIKNSGRLD